MLSLDEMIKHYEKVAEDQEWMANHYDDDSMGKEMCLECAKEHRQIAEWLRELKAYEEAREEIGCLPIVWKEDAGVRKCIGILDKHLMEVNADETDN